MSKPLPKSLHTVTVIVRVALSVQRAMFDRPLPIPTDIEAINTALEILGIDSMPDDHAIVAQCLKQLQRG